MFLNEEIWISERGETIISQQEEKIQAKKRLKKDKTRERKEPLELANFVNHLFELVQFFSVMFCLSE